MNIETFRAYCLSKKGVEEGFPFGEQTLAFKVMGKMFALSNLEQEVFTANLKCDPERALMLREQYDEVRAGYHMNKKHWNTVTMEGSLSEQFVLELIDHSYSLVVQRLRKKDRLFLEQL